MFQGFKDKMTQFYDDVKNKIGPNEEENEQLAIRQKEIQQPIIRKPVKPMDFGLDNSLINSQLNESDLDMQRLDNFQLTFNSEKSVDNHGAKPVTYYKQEKTVRSGVLGNTIGRVSFCAKVS
jgi:hypothetical protein